MHLSFTYAGAFALAFNVLPIALHAQDRPTSESTQNGERIEHMLVTVPLHKLQGNTALATTVLTKTELANQSTNSLGSTLQFKPGLNSSSFGPSVGQPIIRGQGGARVLVLQNSTASSDASAISADHAVSVEPVLAESIEVLRGPSTLLYGGGAIGGVVNVVDKRIPVSLSPNPSLKAELRHGSVNDETTGVVSFDGSINAFAFHIDGLIRNTNSTNVPAFSIEESDETVIENTQSETDSFTLGTSYIFEEGYLGFSYSQLDNLYGIPAGAHDEEEGEEGEEEEEELIQIDLLNKRFDIRGDVHNPFALVEKIRWFFTHTDYQHNELEGDEIGTQWKNDSIENRFEILHTPFGGWHGVLGAQIRQTTLSAVGEESYIPKTDLNQTGIFLIEDIHFDKWKYEVGARVERSTLSPELSENNLKQKFTNVSLSTSALWKINPQLNLGVALSHSERSPVIEELYSNIESEEGDLVEHVATGSIEVGDLDLEQERSNNVDVTLSYKTDNIDTYITLYSNTFTNYIYLQNTNTQQNDVDILQYSQSGAHFYGLEFEVTRSFNFATSGELSLTFFGDNVTGELDNDDDIERLPPNKLGFKANYQTNKWYSSLAWEHGFNVETRTSFDNEKTPSYNRVNFVLNYYPFANGKDSVRKTALFLHVKNLGDQTIINSTSFLKDIAPEPGRSVETGLRFSF